jgi:adenosylcobyric acid synthase
LGGRATSGLVYERQIDSTLDALAEHLESHLDLDAIIQMSKPQQR